MVTAHDLRTTIDPTVEQHGMAWYENVGPSGAGLQWKRHVIGRLPSA